MGTEDSSPQTIDQLDQLIFPINIWIAGADIPLLAKPRAAKALASGTVK
jgi:hypothetical protein